VGNEESPTQTLTDKPWKPEGGKSIMARKEGWSEMDKSRTPFSKLRQIVKMPVCNVWFLQRRSSGIGF
jgi:hypothetical protein